MADIGIYKYKCIPDKQLSDVNFGQQHYWALIFEDEIEISVKANSICFTQTWSQSSSVLK